MPLDYGQVRKRRAPRAFWLGIAPAVAVLVAVLMWNASAHHRVELAQGWVGDRPGCPTISAAAYAAKSYPAGERGIVYDDVIFTRQFGHVMCKDVDTVGGFGFVTHPVCEFTSPTAVRVERGGRVDFFEPGSGNVATVSVERGRISCALGGKFTLFNDPTQLGSVAP